MSNYYIGVDENGLPFIAHASNVDTSAGAGRQSFGRRAHRYLLKIGEGAKAKYAYTQAQVDALMGRGKRALRKAVGLEARDRRDKMYGLAKSGAGDDASKKRRWDEFRNANEEYGKTLLGRAERARASLKVRAGRARDSVRKRASTTLGAIRDKARDVAGYDERQRRDELWEAMRSDKNQNPATKAMAKSAYDSAQATYARTPLGRLERYMAKRKVKKSIRSK